MYNETKDDLLETLRGIILNIKNFKSMGLDENQILVVVFQDGILQINKTMFELYE